MEWFSTLELSRCYMNLRVEHICRSNATQNRTRPLTILCVVLNTSHLRTAWYMEDITALCSMATRSWCYGRFCVLECSFCTRSTKKGALQIDTLRHDISADGVTTAIIHRALVIIIITSVCGIGTAQGEYNSTRTPRARASYSASHLRSKPSDSMDTCN